LKPGDALAEALGKNDVIFEVDNKALSVLRRVFGLVSISPAVSVSSELSFQLSEHPVCLSRLSLLRFFALPRMRQGKVGAGLRNCAMKIGRIFVLYFSHFCHVFDGQVYG